MNMRHVPVLLAVLVLIAACTPTASPPTPAPTEPPSQAEPTQALPTATPTPDRPLAARVNGQPIYLVDYERQVAQWQTAVLIPSGIDLTSPEGQERLRHDREEILNWMIEQALIEQAASEMGIVITDEDVEAELAQIIAETGGEDAFQARLQQDGLTRQDVLSELRAQLIGAAVIERVTSAVPTTAEHVHARHILVGTAAEAEQILAQLQAGADFAELARTFSQDETTAAAGGDLGFFPRGVLLAPQVEEAAFSLQPGQVSSVIESPFGFHIVQVIEREPERALSPEVLQYVREQAFKDWIEGLWAQAVIERYVNQGP